MSFVFLSSCCVFLCADMRNVLEGKYIKIEICSLSVTTEYEFIHKKKYLLYFQNTPKKSFIKLCATSSIAVFVKKMMCVDLLMLHGNAINKE